MVSGKLFSFSNFQTSGNLERDFGIDLKSVSDKLSIQLKLQSFFCGNVDTL